jgi:site-specific DNA-methyltransferase (adenine-specific)
MEIYEISINDLKPYENNPRINDDAIDKVAESIKEFGWKVPVVIDQNNIIVAGHTRLKAAQKLGLDKVPCIIADDLTPEQVKAFRLADNKTAEFAAWDFEKLAEELGEITEIDMAQFGFEEIQAEEGEIIEDEWDEELPEEPKSKGGQIYQLGRHRLMVGDSTKAEDVKALMDGALADLVITDPPYNVDYVGKTKDALKIQNDKMSGAGFLKFLTDAFDNLRENTKEGGAFYIWHAAIETQNFWQACTDAQLQVRQQIIWVKNIFVMGRNDYQWKHEPCLYGWVDGAAHYFISDRTKDTIIADDTVDFDKLKKEEAIELLKKIFEEHEPSSVIFEDRPTRAEIHPTMKPINLFATLMKNSSRSGEKVLDLFGGSGTTIMAAEQLNRTAYVMEFDPKYADAIIQRWEDFTGEKAELVKK